MRGWQLNLRAIVPAEIGKEDKNTCDIAVVSTLNSIDGELYTHGLVSYCLKVQRWSLLLWSPLCSLHWALDRSFILHAHFIRTNFKYELRNHSMFLSLLLGFLSCLHWSNSKSELKKNSIRSKIQSSLAVTHSLA